MMQIIPCEFCGAELIPLEQVSVSITLRKSGIGCSHCNTSRSDEQYRFFCSTACFTAWTDNGGILEWQTT